MAERLSELLRQKVAGIWEAQHQHPFVRGIGDGTLSLERFQFWLRQDYVFLGEYARLLALAAARSPDLETMTRFATLLKETVETEMNLHRACAAEFGISHEQLERELYRAHHSRLHRFLVASSSDGRFRGVGCSVVTLHVGFQRNRPALGYATRPQRKTLRQMDRYVQLKGICRIGGVVSRPARQSRRRSARTRLAEAGGRISHQ